MGASTDLERIRLVTARYHELNGLGRMGLGAAFLTGAGVWTQIPGETLPVIIAAVTVIAIGGAIEWIGRRCYYEPRFGRVAVASCDQRPWGLVYGAVVGVGMGAGYPNVLPLAGAAISSIRLVADWRFRPYLVVDVAAGIAAAVLYGVRPNEIPVDHYFAQVFALTGASAIMTGLCDHLLLVRTLKPKACDSEAELSEHVGTV